MSLTAPTAATAQGGESGVALDQQPPTVEIPSGPTSVPGSDADSLKELVATASRDLSNLVRKEIELAKAEITVTLKGVIIGIAPLLIAGVFALGAALLLAFTVAEAWSRLLGRPLGFLVGAGTLFVVAGLAGLAGKVLLGRVRKPERTPATIKDDLAMAKSLTKSKG